MSIENKPKRRRKAPAILPLCAPGVLRLSVGVSLNADEPCVHLAEVTAKLIGVASGDYVVIDNDERGTRITRELCTCSSSGRQHANYAYFDRDSLDYLCADADAQITLQKSDFNLDVP